MTPLNIWTVYENPLDFPGQFVARRFENNKPTLDHFADPLLERVREWVHLQAAQYGQGSPYRLDRAPSDDPDILETWL